jgi:hypothetical protein
MVGMPKDVGSGAIDWISSHEIFEQHVREREGQEAPEGQKEDEGHDADDEGDGGDEDEHGDDGDEGESEASEAPKTDVSYSRLRTVVWYTDSCLQETPLQL